MHASSGTVYVVPVFAVPARLLTPGFAVGDPVSMFHSPPGASESHLPSYCITRAEHIN